MAERERNRDRRSTPREHRPISCEIHSLGARHTGVVIDLSREGLVVRTRALAPIGTPVIIVIRRPGGEVWEIEARVTRADQHARGKALISARGLGVAITDAPGDFFRFVEKLAG